MAFDTSSPAPLRKALGSLSGDVRLSGTNQKALGPLAWVTETATASGQKALGPLVRSERDILGR